MGPAKDKHGVRESFATVKFLFAKNGRSGIKEFWSTTIYIYIYTVYIYILYIYIYIYNNYNYKYIYICTTSLTWELSCSIFLMPGTCLNSASSSESSGACQVARGILSFTNALRMPLILMPLHTLEPQLSHCFWGQIMHALMGGISIYIYKWSFAIFCYSNARNWTAKGVVHLGVTIEGRSQAG